MDPDVREQECIAIIGMGCRFPGASTPDEFWRNLADGVESIERLTPAELRIAGVPSELIGDPSYVPAGAFLKGIDLFDADLFGFTRAEAESLDPQHRLFLECSWEAIEHSGHVPDNLPGRVGVFAGTGASQYAALPPSTDLDAPQFQSWIGNDKDYLASRLAFKLNFRGPSLTIQTACSTALVSICTAAQSLLVHQCDLAIAGGVRICVPQRTGYRYRQGLICSPDGHCRAFDASAQGTVPGNAVGVVVLKRQSDAVRDGDTIYALIKGFAVNNDGSTKAGFTAPGVAGQREVIEDALAFAGISAESIGFVETHGTGTPLGDPIEITSLTEAFRQQTPRRGYCLLGSVKTNIGHTLEAAGAAGLIKTVLALCHRQIPPTLHFHSINPAIRLEETPFRINTVLEDWPDSGRPRRAGVSSFGIGGTNAHVVLEEAPSDQSPLPAPSGPLALPISARSEKALLQLGQKYSAWFTANPASRLQDLCWTACFGRNAFSHRIVLIGSSMAVMEEALAAFLSGQPHPGLLQAGGEDKSSRSDTSQKSDHLSGPIECALRFLAGEMVDWSPQFIGRRCRRIAIPTLVFQRERFWVDRTDSGPASSEARIASPSSIKRALAQRIHSLGASAIHTRYRHLIERLNELALAYASNLIKTAAGECRSPGRDLLKSTLQVVDHQDRRLFRLMEMLAEAGMVSAKSSGWVMNELPFVGTVEIEESIKGEFPENHAEVTLLATCGRELGNVLAGRTDPLELLFPSGDFKRAASIYRDAPHAQALNELLRDAVSAAVAETTSTGRISVLEIGGGTASTTSYVLPSLGPKLREYVFTDIGKLFLQRAAERFHAEPKFSCRHLNIELDPVEQGFSSESFDLVIAVNVLHATRDLRVTLRNTARLLKPGGLLFLLEITRNQPVIELTSGLIDGWWRFEDRDVRQSSPLLPSAAWIKLLGSSGFHETELLGPGTEGELFQHSLFVAERHPNAAQESAEQFAPPVGTSPVTSNSPRIVSASDGRIPEAFLQAAKEATASVIGIQSGEIPVEIPLAELGLDSLMAVELRARIKRETGADLSMLGTAGHRTIREVARAIAESIELQSRPSVIHSHVDPNITLPPCVLPIQTGGTRHPFFCVHPLAGSPMCYLEIARGLGPDQPFYGLQAPGLADTQPCLKSVSQMAEFYVDAIRRIQPLGPYALGGWSFGGFVAWEMASRLEALGEKVSFLGLMDGGPTSEIVHQTHMKVSNLISGTWLILKCLAQINWPRTYSDFRFLGQAIGISLPVTWNGEARRSSSEKRKLVRVVWNGIISSLRICSLNLQAASNYKPNQFKGSVFLFRACSGRGNNDSLTDGIRLLAGDNLTVIPVEGNHMSIVLNPPTARILAGALKTQLDAAAAHDGLARAKS